MTAIQFTFPLSAAISTTPSSAPAASLRLAKRIAQSHGVSRRGAEKLIAEGRVRVNGAVAPSPALDVTPDDAVLVDGKILDKVAAPKVS